MIKRIGLAVVTILAVNFATAATAATSESVAKPAVAAAAVNLSEICSKRYTSPEGCWKTIDDKTGDEKSIILIDQNSMGKNNREGVYTGKVLKILKTHDGRPPETARCEKCKGRKAGQLIEGMTIMWGVRRDGGEWSGGEILDPLSGDVYNVKFSLSDNGKDLYVRGYLGISLFGRTQTWKRYKG